MRNSFTVHCIAWHAGAPLLRDVRALACEIGLPGISKALTDEMDERSRHALALCKSGRAIGCARITPDGCIERMVVLPHEHEAHVEAALVEALNDYSHQFILKKQPVTGAKR